MVLLKRYLTHCEQINIIKVCRDHGLCSTGFYQPRFQSGATMRLHMMCMGLNWNHKTIKYEERRSVDGLQPPSIPTQFTLLVQRAIKDAHGIIAKECRVSNVTNILPAMSPDICIVNFYTTIGRLGLHKDRDENKESLRKGLPVVSFSLGDSAEFLYGDHRHTEEAEKKVLEPGDVLIFGGDDAEQKSKKKKVASMHAKYIHNFCRMIIHLEHRSRDEILTWIFVVFVLGNCYYVDYIISKR
ncbi:2OG-FeII_Oxy_2 domain-containing protein [Cephalotus follicularis]|uniref:2OG-FeII_Oxy_2 domain-containing protein n=1 Tax=Cephalotus follicularis TaxID=3775 RepID=A0A1Q3BAH4_CEPFO|nr:2OG-FeII_Oxy_2 domain-containing protein [Cephalotus follicularis]